MARALWSKKESEVPRLLALLLRQHGDQQWLEQCPDVHVGLQNDTHPLRRHVRVLGCTEDRPGHQAGGGGRMRQSVGGGGGGHGTAAPAGRADGL